MSSKRAVRRKSCKRKVAHANPARAYAARGYIARRSPEHGAFMSVYRCQFCHKWHVGHTPYRVRQAMAAEAR